MVDTPKKLSEDEEEYLKLLKKLLNQVPVKKEELPEKIASQLKTESAEEIITILFSELKGVEFLLISENPKQKVYGDPEDPDNVAKQIRYLWNKETQKWIIIAGMEANAYIADPNSKQLVTIDNGKVQSAGKNPQYEVENKFHIEIFAVPEVKDQLLKTKVTKFSNLLCSAQRSVTIGEIAEYLGESQYAQIDSIYEDESGNTYKWVKFEDRILGFKVNADQSVDLLVPEKNKSQYLAMIAYECNAGGFSGAQFMHSSNLTSNGARKDPSFSKNIIQISDAELQKHLVFAKEGKVGTEIIINTQEKVETIKPTARIQSASVSKIFDSKLPEYIKVTGSAFEFQCLPFKDPNCKDESFDNYEGTIYCLKQKGSDFNDKSNVIIIEESSAGDIRIRSGYNQAEKKAVAAKITVTKNGKEYIATLSTENGQVKQGIDYSTDSPFKTAGLDQIFCDGCLEHYTKENQTMMKGGKRQVTQMSL